MLTKFLIVLKKKKNPVVWKPIAERAALFFIENYHQKETTDNLSLTESMAAEEISHW